MGEQLPVFMPMQYDLFINDERPDHNPCREENWLSCRMYGGFFALAMGRKRPLLEQMLVLRALLLQDNKVVGYTIEYLGKDQSCQQST